MENFYSDLITDKLYHRELCVELLLIVRLQCIMIDALTIGLFSEFDGTVQIEKLKDKMGTRQLPTAELTLSGVPALLLAEKGIANIVPMLQVRSLIQIGQLYPNMIP